MDRDILLPNFTAIRCARELDFTNLPISTLPNITNWVDSCMQRI